MHFRHFIPAGLLAGFVPAALAQDDTLGQSDPALSAPTTRDAQDWVDSLFQDPTRMPGVLGRSRLLGQTSQFDNDFNPAIGVVIDALGEFADAQNGASRYNRVRIRSLELNVASQVDPLGWAYVVAAFADTGDESSVELEEAAMWMTELPDTFSLRAGRYLADFGKWNPMHTHDKPFVNEDPVRGEYFGGPLFTTGLEVHHWFGLGDVPVRWSVGVASDAEGDDHDGGHHHGDGVEPFGRRGIDNWAATARLTAQHDVSQNGYFQWGLSGFYAPGMLVFSEFPAGSGTIVRDEVRNAVVAADLTYRVVDATDQTAHTASVELWHQNGQIVDDTTWGIQSEAHNGVWGFYERAFSTQLAAGVVGSWFEHRESLDGGDFLSGNEAGATRGAFVSWYFSEFNRLRFQVLHTNPGSYEEKFWTFAIQWDMILGAHAHGVDW